MRVSYPFLGMGVAFRELTAEHHMQIEAMIETLRPAPLNAPEPVPDNSIHPASMPIILNAAAALQALAEFFAGHTVMSQVEFIRLLRKSQGV